MNTPGTSLFQGTESIKINTSLERQVEEEALEDQRRRNDEVCYCVFLKKIPY